MPRAKVRSTAAKSRRSTRKDGYSSDEMSWWTSSDPEVWMKQLERLRYAGKTMKAPCENNIIGWKETGLSAGTGW